MTVILVVLAFVFGGAIGFNFGAAYMIEQFKKENSR